MFMQIYGTGGRYTKTIYLLVNNRRKLIGHLLEQVLILDIR